VKRYNVQACATGDQPGAYLDVEEATDGEWVKYKDVSPLLAVLDVPDMENAIARAGSLAAGFHAARFERDSAYAAMGIVDTALWHLLGEPPGEMDAVRFIRMLEERLK
jgi:L-alanine-DL-glutamate epimerase-like enolase superfamily enzyme